MDGLDLLKAFAKSRGLRVARCMIRNDNVPELLVAQTKLTVDGAPCAVRVSSGFLIINMRVSTRLQFSVGERNKTYYRRTLTFAALPGLTGYSFTAESVREAELWLSDTSYAQLITDLIAEPGDGVHVHRAEISFTGRAREIEPVFARLLVLRSVVAVRDEAAAAPVDVSMLPAELGAFVRQFEHLAVDDDELREELRERLTPSERATLVRAAKPLFSALNGFLGNLAGPWPDAALKLSRLGELVSEIMVDQ